MQTARKNGLVGLESHIEDPAKSDTFKKYPLFMKQHHAVSFLCDTLKVLLTGTVEDHHLAEILDLDLEKSHEEAIAVPTALTRVGDAMPGFGIVHDAEGERVDARLDQTGFHLRGRDAASGKWNGVALEPPSSSVMIE